MTSEAAATTARPGEPIAPVRREVRVDCDVATAFELFTAHLGSWWPLERHSVYGERASVALEGDRLVERLGAEATTWAEIVELDRPRLLRLAWHPGSDAGDATDVLVEFREDADGTLVTLTHTGWERLAEHAVAARADYDTGWPTVLAGFAARTVATPPDAQPLEARWFVLEHTPGPALGDGGSVFAHPLFREHAAFLDRLDDRGWLVAAGPLDPTTGTGMTVLRVPAADAEHVDDLVRSDDGAVRGGLLEVRVRAWDVRATGTMDA